MTWLATAIACCAVGFIGSLLAFRSGYRLGLEHGRELKSHESAARIVELRMQGAELQAELDVERAMAAELARRLERRVGVEG